MPALIFGVAFGNVLLGVPFRFDDTLRLIYEGTLLGLLNPFALLCGPGQPRHAGDAQARAWLALKAAGAGGGPARSWSCTWPRSH